MIERRCACGKPLRENQTFCGDCLHRTRNHLANQAAWLTDIEIELARLARKMAANDGPRLRPVTMWAQAGDVYLEHITEDLLREWDRRARAAANVMHEQRALLVAWSRLITDEGLIKDTSWLINSVSVMAQYVAAALPRLRAHDAGPELVAEFRTLGAQIIRVIDSPPNRARFNVGPCPQTYPDQYNQETHCAGHIEVIIPGDDKPRILRCVACKAEWRSDKNEWMKVTRRIQEREAQMKQQRTMAEAIGRKT
jgi:hypothetical protein